VVEPRPVVSNTTPLINLAGIGLLDLLPRLYGVIWIPEQVADEFNEGAQTGDPNIKGLPWITVITPAAIDPLVKGLGVGEAAAISLARTSHARAVLLDEKRGRRIAEQLQLPVVGTLGVLVAAKQEGLISSVQPALQKMIAQGRRLSPNLIAHVLRAAGE